MSEHNEKVDLEEISQKIHRTEYVDGFMFIFIGFILFVAAGTINLHPAFSIILVISFILSFPISKAMRSRFTYPRIGYFKVKTDDLKKVFPGILLFTSGIIIAFLILMVIFANGDTEVIYNYENWYRFLPIVFGLIMFGPSLDLVDKTGERKYYGIGVFSSILGLIIAWINFQNGKFGLTIYLVLLGGISLIIGFITFVRFIKKYPIITDSQHLGIQEDSDDI
jgi:hypothetical protein